MVDGVGYPAVGSIVGVSNADLALALGEGGTGTATATPPPPILLVGRPGVGDAVDSFNLNATFFRHRGLRVLGAVFNRLPPDGFYALANCKEASGCGCCFARQRRGGEGARCAIRCEANDGARPP